MPWFGVLPPSEHYSLDYVPYSLLGNTVRVRISRLLAAWEPRTFDRYQPHLA